MQYHEYTDAELVSMLHQGDATAFEAIYRRYVSDLYRYARKNIGRKEDCKEILQEVFLSLWERHTTLHIVALRPYLFGAVRYKVIRYLQHCRVKRKYEEHYALFEVVYESMEAGERSAEAIQSRLLEGLEELPHRCREAVRLRIDERLSNGEIAERMNISKKTVEVYMGKAFATLRGRYGEIFDL